MWEKAGRRSFALAARIDDVDRGFVCASVFNIGIGPTDPPVVVAAVDFGDGREQRIGPLTVLVGGEVDTRDAGVGRRQIRGQARFILIRAAADALLLILVFAVDASTDRGGEVDPGLLDPTDPVCSHEFARFSGMVPAGAPICVRSAITKDTIFIGSGPDADRSCK